MKRRKRISKKCFVPKCESDDRSNKIFFDVPLEKARRLVWFKAVNLDSSQCKSRVLFCCEDHFELPVDLMPCGSTTFEKGEHQLKNGVVPHLFSTTKRKKQEAFQAKPNSGTVKPGSAAPSTQCIERIKNGTVLKRKIHKRDLSEAGISGINNKKVKTEVDIEFVDIPSADKYVENAYISKSSAKFDSTNNSAANVDLITKKLSEQSVQLDCSDSRTSSPEIIFSGENIWVQEVPPSSATAPAPSLAITRVYSGLEVEQNSDCNTNTELLPSIHRLQEVSISRTDNSYPPTNRNNTSFIAHKPEPTTKLSKSLSITTVSRSNDDSDSESNVIGSSMVTNAEQSADINFLKSLGPDMHRLSRGKKLVFKLGILNLLNELLK